MIPYNTVTAWGVTHPWATREQIEQDMLLSRAICDVFRNEDSSIIPEFKRQGFV